MISILSGVPLDEGEGEEVVVVTVEAWNNGRMVKPDWGTIFFRWTVTVVRFGLVIDTLRFATMEEDEDGSG